jgi:hypothetical protein
VALDQVVADLGGVTPAHSFGDSVLLLQSRDIVDLGQLDFESILS